MKSDRKLNFDYHKKQNVSFPKKIFFRPKFKRNFYAFIIFIISLLFLILGIIYKKSELKIAGIAFICISLISFLWIDVFARSSLVEARRICSLSLILDKKKESEKNILNCIENKLKI